MNRAVTTTIIAILFAMSTTTVSAAETTPTAGSSSLILSGTLVLDRNCDGKLGRADTPLSARIALHIVNLASGEVEQTVDANRGRWSARVPIFGRYAVQAPAWMARQGYAPAPNGDSLLVDGISKELTGKDTGVILVCKTPR